jgi:hypothetical protein
MKKCILFIITTVGFLSCKQGNTSNQNKVDTAKLSSTKSFQNQEPYQRLVDTKYEYVYAEGGRILIENSLPKGEGYTGPNGKVYFKTIFWTRIINETNTPLELKIHFPANWYELPSSPDRRFKIFLPSDTMTFDKVNLINYGLTSVKSFLDNNISKPASLQRSINPKEASGFYVVILFDKGLIGPFRTGLSVKGQNLFYRISKYESTPSHALADEKEIDCGSINLKNLLLQK